MAELTCSICFDSFDIEKVHFVDNCAHSFCLECLKDYTTMKIKEAHVNIKCPELKCTSDFTYYEIISLSEPSMVKKYERFLLEQQLRDMPDIKWCPAPNCETPCPTSQYYTWASCPTCKINFCKDCCISKDVHDGFTCEEIKLVDGNLNSFEDWIKAKGNRVKQCPKCEFYCEKVEGCDKITCAKCSAFFCWICKYIFNKNDVASHLDAHYKQQHEVSKPTAFNMPSVDTISVQMDSSDDEKINEQEYTLQEVD